MKVKKILCCVLFFGIVATSNAQLWKKLKKKAQEKISKAEDKLLDKLDKKTDNVIDSTLNGKSKNTKEPLNKGGLTSYGSASINHSNTYPNIKIDNVSKAKVNKTGSEFKIKGNWGSTSADVFDGYSITLKNTTLEELKMGKSFQIPEEADFYIGYDPLLDERKNRKENWKGAFENRPENGSITVRFIKDQSLSVSFSVNGKLSKYIETNSQLEEGYYDKKPMSIDGSVTSSNPEYTITKERKNQQNNASNTISEDEKMEMLQKVSPTINIPSTFSFNKSLEVKMIDERGDAQIVEFLTGIYPDIYAMSIAPKEMQGQQMLVVNTPNAATMFMDMGGMKIKKSTSLDQMGSQFNMEENLPEDGDYVYKKTGNTKTIIGYLCEEYKVDFDYTNSKGSLSFWVSKDFPIQNKAIPMLGMTLNNPYFSGFVLEMNTIQNNKKFTIEVTNLSSKNVSINTNEYKKMGF